MSSSHNMLCLQFERIVSEYIDELLPDKEKLHWDDHLARCARCRKTLRETHYLVQNLHHLPEFEPSPEFHRKLRLKLIETTKSQSPLFSKMWLQPGYVTVVVFVFLTLFSTVLYFNIKEKGYTADSIISENRANQESSPASITKTKDLNSELPGRKGVASKPKSFIKSPDSAGSAHTGAILPSEKPHESRVLLNRQGEKEGTDKNHEQITSIAKLSPKQNSPFNDEFQDDESEKEQLDLLMNKSEQEQVLGKEFIESDALAQKEGIVLEKQIKQESTNEKNNQVESTHSMPLDDATVNGLETKRRERRPAIAYPTSAAFSESKTRSTDRINGSSRPGAADKLRKQRDKRKSKESQSERERQFNIPTYSFKTQSKTLKKMGKVSLRLLSPDGTLGDHIYNRSITLPQSCITPIQNRYPLKATAILDTQWNLQSIAFKTTIPAECARELSEHLRNIQWLEIGSTVSKEKKVALELKLKD